MKWSGRIGFARTEETQPGCYNEVITEKRYYGDIITKTVQEPDSALINSDIKMTNRISVLCNSFMSKNMGHARYMTIKSSKWKISSMSINGNRIIFTLGGIYNEQED